MKIEINATVNQTVTIKPIDVIDQLIESYLSHGSRVQADGNKYYIWELEQVGPTSHSTKTQIPKATYEYILALQTVRNFLKK
jgi:hypothetical protein